MEEDAGFELAQAFIPSTVFKTVALAVDANLP